MHTLFFSYSHKDEALRDQLEVHLAAMKRSGLISAWHDRQIPAGAHIAETIDQNLEAADVVLLLVSPDFIASDYCYQNEMARALERMSKGECAVIPVILRPCDWHGLPFGQLLAAPTDGKAVTKWSNIDDAFLAIVEAVKTALNAFGAVAKKKAKRDERGVPSPSALRSSNLRIAKTFTDFEKDTFRNECFATMANYFEGSLNELRRRNPEAGIETQFRQIDAERFTAAIYKNGEKASSCTVSIASEFGSGRGIVYSNRDDARRGGYNEMLHVESDDQKLFLKSSGMMMYSRDNASYSQEGAAELYWSMLLQPLQGNQRL